MKKLITFALSALLAFTAFADVKISDLPAGTTLSGTEAIPVVQSSQTVKTTPSAINTYVQGQTTSSVIVGKFTSCSGTQYLGADGACHSASSGSVTSVALTAPSGFIVGGSPVTSSGTIAITGTLDVSAGGTGATTNSGLLLGNGTSPVTSYAGTTCTNQFPRSLSGSGVATCATVANTDLANSTITINGVSTALGGSRSLVLNSSDFANEGTATTVLHGNAAGNPSFGAVSLTADISGILGVTNGGSGASTLSGVLKGNGTSAIGSAASSDILGLWSGTCNSGTFLRGDGSCAAASSSPGGSNTQIQFNDSSAFGGSSGLTWNKTTNVLTLNSVTQSAITPVLLFANNAGSGLEGLTIRTQDGSGGTFDVNIGTSDFSLVANVNNDVLFSATNSNAGNTAAAHLNVINDQNDVADLSIISSGASPSSNQRQAVLSYQGASTDLRIDNLTGNAAMFDRNLNTVIGGRTSHATTDTNGFLYIPSVAGVQTGVPANTTGVYANSVPMRWDSTNHAFDVYDGSWRQILTLSSPVSVAQGGTGAASITGLVLGNGASAMSAYAGTSCTNQFPRSLSASGAATCASVSLTADITGILGAANGGTGNGFFAVSGPSSSTKTFTFPNASATVLTSNAAVTVAQGGTGVATLTTHGVLLGEGTSNVSAVAAMAADTLLQGQGVSADPAAVSVNNCGDSTHALSYSTSTHTFGCQSIPGSGGGTPGGSDTQVQYNSSGSFAGSAAFTWTDSTHTMVLGDTTTSPVLQAVDRSTSGAGVAFLVAAGAANTTGNGGKITVKGGAGGSSSGQGGGVDILGGVPINGNGGSVNMTGSNGVSTGSGASGGSSNITGGNGVGTGAGGSASVSGGTAGTTGGANGVSINGGSGGATSGNGGTITITAGQAPTSGTGGNVTISAGASHGTAKNGGSITITPTAASDSSGVSGSVQFAKWQSDTSYDYTTPTTGFSYTIPDMAGDAILDPAGTLSTGTITMPAKPNDGQIIHVSSSQIITTLTVSANSGQSIKNAPTTLAAGGKFSYIYRASNTTWYVY